ncbi:MAG: right-handed parallel beta-helix repeat-containing protein [Thermodesulfobacteriota bacterium]|nr:right-handed parallel beta-helix repeat-containing protein [Thermodesulfobacteriota bacterium]
MKSKERVLAAGMVLVATVFMVGLGHDLGASAWGSDLKRPWERREIRKRQMQDQVGGLPENILKQQSLGKVVPPSIDAAVAMALKAAEEAAGPLIDTAFHKGRRLRVPGDFKTIQDAIEAAAPGDMVVVMPGTYYELIVMKDGVKLASDSAGGGDEPVTVEGATMSLPRRTLRTIIDGSRASPSHHGMIDFDGGVGRHTIVDGFTIQHLPKQDHHVPGHAHALNVRGSSPVIMNCYVRKNGSTGIGSHVVYGDQDQKISRRDFRWANVKHRTEAVIYHNIVSENVGLGIGCNHFSAPHLLGNEVFLNSDAELGHDPSPGMGAKHGAAPVIIGNIVHDNAGGGILAKVGQRQGAYAIDGPTHPNLMTNVVYRNGNVRPAIACSGGGSMKKPVRFVGNFVYDAGVVGLAVSDGAVAIVEDNLVSGSAGAGIAIDGATAIRLNGNQVTRADAPGFVIRDGAKILEMVGNAADSNRGPRFMLRGGTIAGFDG